jgi:hypothetical protein
LLAACGPSGFTDSTVVSSVRILASRSDQPYARPGATVRSQVLAVDGRPDGGADGASNEPMQVYWLPFVCVNPPNDAFYACFSAFEPNPSGVEQYGESTGDGGLDGGGMAMISGAISAWDGGPEAGVGATLPVGGGMGGGSLPSIPTGVDISQFLIQGPRAVFHLPSDIVSSHRHVKGAAYPYGLAVVFNIACAGHVEVIALDAGNANPEQIPFGCFNAQGQQLPASDYVIGYTEVFAYDSLSNTNPVISSLSFRDASVPLDGSSSATVSFPHCTDSNTNDCPDNYAIVGVPDASWELDPQDPGPDGGPAHEEVWVDYYATIGSLSDDAILVFDPSLGRIKAPHQEDLQSVTQKQQGTMWAIVHDNRGGASWITVPLDVQ